MKACGKILHPAFRFAGASLDRVLFDSSAQPQCGLLIVKCPYYPFIAGQAIAEAVASRADFCCTINSGQILLKTDHAYFYQIQGQLAITGAR